MADLIRKLRYGDRDERRSAATNLGMLEDASAIPALIRALGDIDLDVRSDAEDALVRIGKPAVPALIDALGDESAWVRENAAITLGRITDVSAVPALIEALRSKDQYPLVRKNAAISLGNVGDPSAVPALTEALREDDPEVRGNSALALTLIGKPAVPHLLGTLCDDRLVVRCQSAWVLGYIGDERAVDALIRALEDPGAAMRHKAAEALGKICEASAAPPLIGALGDDDEAVRREAAKTLAGYIDRIGKIDILLEIEGLLRKGCGSLPDQDEKIEIVMEMTKLLRRISEKKNEVAARKDVLLDGKPKLPKGGKVFRSMRRVCNGNF